MQPFLDRGGLQVNYPRNFLLIRRGSCREDYLLTGEVLTGKVVLASGAGSCSLESGDPTYHGPTRKEFREVAPPAASRDFPSRLDPHHRIIKDKIMSSEWFRL